MGGSDGVPLGVPLTAPARTPGILGEARRLGWLLAVPAICQHRPVTAPKPRVFIGSSSEGLPVAHALQAELEREFDVTIWTQGVFGLGALALESLEAALRDFDYAILVLTPDDLIDRRGAGMSVPRDNVIYEAGLFMGALGRHRTFLVAPRDSGLAIPTDLAGITIAQYRQRADNNLRAAIGPVATNIRVAIASDRRPPAAPASRVFANESPDLARLLDDVDRLSEALEAGSASAQLRGDQARLYGALLRRVKLARPRDEMIAALEEPRETALSGVFTTTRAGAQTGLTFMRSALISAP